MFVEINFPTLSFPLRVNKNKQLCSLNNAQLASIEDDKEMNFLEENLEPKRYPIFEYFIGLRKSSEKWTWISNDSIEVAPHKHPWTSERFSDGRDTHCAKMYFEIKNKNRLCMTIYTAINFEQKMLDTSVRSMLAVTMKKLCGN